MLSASEYWPLVCPFSCHPSLGVAQSGCRTLRWLAFELHVMTVRKGEEPHYVIIAYDLTHVLNEMINYSE
jgi:hypothetical protein